ncbi:MAG: tetratricopeptide repeat protein, partial [Deltaproteobacteria bacterium]
TAYYFTFAEYDLAKAAAAYRSALVVDPDNLISLNNLSGLLMRQRQYAEAESLAVRATRTGRGTVFFRTAMNAQVAQGRYTEAQATLEAAQKRMPGNPALASLSAEFAVARDDFVSADSQLTRLRQDQRASPLWQAYTDGALAIVRGAQGRLADAEGYLRAFATGGEAHHALQDYYSATAGLAEIDIRYRNRPADAIAALAAALSRHPLDSMPAPDRPYNDLARLYALAGKPDQAKRYLRDYESVVPAAIRAGEFGHDLATGYVAEAEGRHQDAIAAYRKYHEEAGGCGICGLYELGTTYDRMGQADSALAAYERLVTTPNLNRMYNAGMTLAPTLKRLGELYEARGDRKRARGYYEKFVALWKDADPELQPGVKEVRGRLAKLAQEPGA